MAFLGYLLLPVLSLLALTNARVGVASHKQSTSIRSIPNSAFDVGERLVFDINYGFVTAGTAVMVIPGFKYLNGRKAYEINTYAASTPTFDNIFKVRDKYSTFVDVEGIFPHRFEQHVHEGNYNKDYDAYFDQDELTAESNDGTKCKIPKYVNDILSAFYYVRTLDLTQYHKGDKISLENFYDGKTHPLDVLILGRQRIEVEAGVFDCIVVEPMVVEGGLFKNEGSIKLWLTNDANKMPVKVSTKVVVGSIDVTLTKYQGLKNPVTARVANED
ncbi:MAG: DUF3108 domain-containing protein [Bacteroidota bacterium]|nr:DUF3108 domain-containing protein [Bacteroidota bacterium]MDP4230262.1 DUF3108 domain-containing protein [Bacteroidota bacterium]MDP4236108.1 DUF3108 domain-containing protein [Bacteroidota bacterium]